MSPAPPASGTATTIDGKDGADIYTITHTGLAGALNVTDTGGIGIDQLTDSSTAAGPETIGISDTQVTRSGGSQTLTYSGLETLIVNGTPAADTINVTKTAAGTATTVNAGTGFDIFGAIDLTQIGAAGLTIHAGGNGESLTLNTTTAGTVTVTGTTVQRTGNGAITYDGLTNLNLNGTSGADTFNVTSTASGATTTIDGKDGADIYTITHTGLAGALNVTDTGASGSDQLTDSSTAAGPETIGISDTQVTRSGGSQAANLLRPGIVDRQRHQRRRHDQRHQDRRRHRHHRQRRHRSRYLRRDRPHANRRSRPNDPRRRQRRIAHPQHHHRRHRHSHRHHCPAHRQRPTNLRRPHESKPQRHQPAPTRSMSPAPLREPPRPSTAKTAPTSTPSPTPAWPAR